MVRRAIWRFASALVVSVASWPTLWSSPAGAALPSGFAETVTRAGLDQPTAFDFAPDGRLFVAGKRGVVKTFDNVGDKTPAVFADRRTQVHNYADRGLIGIEVDRSWPARPYVYVHYVYDARIGRAAPVYGTAGGDSDACPTVFGLPDCVARVRVSRLTASGTTSVAEEVLLDNVRHRFPFHDGGGSAMSSDVPSTPPSGRAPTRASTTGSSGTPAATRPCPPVGLGSLRRPRAARSTTPAGHGSRAPPGTATSTPST